MRKQLKSASCLLALLLAACQAADPPPKDALDQQLAAKLPETDYATRKKVRELLSNTLTNLTYIESGTFTMGDWGALNEDGTWLPYFPPTAEQNKAHQVTLSSYSLGKYEATWEEYDTFLLATGRPIILRATNLGGNFNFQEEKRAPYSQDPTDPMYIKRPATDRWQDAKDYCLWLGELTGLPFDLPTEAQFEYAARNRGEKWLFATYNGEPIEHQHPYIDRLNRSGTPVGTQLPPNPLGLYDMGENAKEWVNDWYSSTYYKENPEITDPQGPDNGTEKTVRSLGVGSLAFSFSRIGLPEKIDDGHLVTNGFRCAVNSPKPVTLKIPE
ncbi:formylglycine-generating enzyme family protein [Pseudomonas sp.]|uniref:formylglycine-generating enzyme family protein n=1 Tax=Pseudomonas sp. TaxID=306 RepID=UPI003563D4B4